MKKMLSIIFAMLILASGMHYTIATHFCGGEIASKKLSVTGSITSCGMETTEQDGCSAPNAYESNCCKNQIDIYSIDTNYENAVYKMLESVKNLIHDFYIPATISFNSLHLSQLTDNGVSPPDTPLVSAVSLTEIRVFRI